jgi:hypothetical protein
MRRFDKLTAPQEVLTDGLSAVDAERTKSAHRAYWSGQCRRVQSDSGLAISPASPSRVFRNGADHQYGDKSHP